MIARALILLCWTFAAVADEPALSDLLKAQIQPRFPAPIETLQCDPGNAPVFQCRGRLTDGRLIEVEGKRAADGAITITDLVHHVPAAQSMREFLHPVLQPPLATLDCPPEQPTLGAIECSGTLTDGSRFTVAGNRRRDFALEVGPVTYDAAAPAPLVRAARARGLNAQPGFEMLIQQMPYYLEFFGHSAAAHGVREDARFLRELIYPQAMAAEIDAPLRYHSDSVA